MNVLPVIKHLCKRVALVALLPLFLAGCESSSTFYGEQDATSTPGLVDSSTIMLGSGIGSSFVPGVLQIGLTSLSAGGTTEVLATLADSSGALYTTPTEVSFHSLCTGSNKAEITTPVTSVDGIIVTSYTATGCSGADTIYATASIDGREVSATGSLTIQPAVAGQVVFVSAEPAEIGIEGTGAVELSTLTFKVLDSSGAAIANEDVTFSLNTTVGGITLSTTTATSNSAGEVLVVVASGTVSTVVRVTATLVSNTLISTQSESLVIYGGLSDQGKLSLSADVYNPEGWNFDGEVVNLTVYASDHFSNPVRDGTAVYFTAEGGQMAGTCTISNGSCSAEWKSANRRPQDGRVTVTATMQGEENFSDDNGNGVLDDGEIYGDLPEAWYDYNENGVYDAATNLVDAYGATYREEFRDFDSDGLYDAADGKYNGVLCNPANIVNVCGASRSVDARGDLVLVMSGSHAYFSYGASPLSFAKATVGKTNVTIMDVNGQTLPNGTTISIVAGDDLVLNSSESYTVVNTSVAGGIVIPIFVEPADTSVAGTDLVTITVTTPNGIETIDYLDVSWF
ncbi:MAG: hypothetical protein OQL08_05555 [Gammaproteobacteria bacterium]|nr:hypothetical protein [Gammaproteobacteria bacterium]